MFGGIDVLNHRLTSLHGIWHARALRYALHLLPAAMIACICQGTYAQTIVPRLNEEGHRGEIARKMKDKSAAQFDRADANKDGRLSKEEVATVSNYYATNFEKHDTNKDGFLSWEEFVGHNRWPK
jgi:hypothetical protein